MQSGCFSRKSSFSNLKDKQMFGRTFQFSSVKRKGFRSFDKGLSKRNAKVQTSGGHLIHMAIA